MFYFVVLINWKNKFSSYSIFTLQIYWTFYSFYWSFWSILLCKINHFTEHNLLANWFFKYWTFYPKYLALNIVSFFLLNLSIISQSWSRKYWFYKCLQWDFKLSTIFLYILCFNIGFKMGKVNKKRLGN